MDQMPENAIAVIGIAGRFPGAGSIETFRENIFHNKESITSFSNEELIAAGVSESQIRSPHYVKARGILEGIELFDADFFSMAPVEAQLTDPQHRLFLECAWEALENAGYCSDHYSGSIGVYGGTARSTYFLNNLFPHRDLMEKMGNYLVRIGNEQDFLTTKVSYKLNLKGPSLSIQTACSTSLVAICTACNHLLTYQCDMALAGGVSIYVPQQSGYIHQESMIFSSDGRCRPFDAAANGTVPSSGVGIVVLKRLEDALEDRDHIYAVIRGYGMNNDGGNKISYSAPSVQGQAAAIDAAIAMAGIDPATISYAEAHGTATLLGDPIEIDALVKAFQKYTQKQGFCAIGSVKSNIGHCMEAAGAMGLIKTILALQERKIPPSLHFNTLNPQIKLENTPFYVSNAAKDWPSSETPRRACVSSFGIGGTNAHLILEESPNRILAAESEGPHLLVLSAKTRSALKTMARNLAKHLEEHPEVPLDDVAYTLQMGRKAFEHRKAIVCRNREEAIALLLDAKELTAETACASGERKSSRIPLPTYPFEKKRYWIDPLVNEGKSEVECEESSLESSLLKIWKQFLGVDQIGVDDNFFTLGGDSLLALQTISQIQEELGISLKLHMFFQFPTISQLAAAISKQTLEKSCLISLKAGDGKHAPLFFIHGIDGNVFSLKPLAETMAYPGPIFGIQAEHSLKTIEEMASFYLRQIQKMYPEGPYLLCGYSFGGIIAFEMGRQLDQMGCTPKFLGMIDVINPEHDCVPRNNDLEMLNFLVELLSGKESSGLSLLQCTGLHQLPVGEQQKSLLQIQQHLESLKHYFPKAYPGNVVFFEAEQRFFRLKHIPLSTTWHPVMKGKMTVHEAKGNHLDMLKPPHLTNLANLLDLSLNE